MKKLQLKEITKVSGGNANQESTKIQDGFLKTTLHIPPHEFEQYVDVYLDLQNAKNK